ncbi:MAG: hypothetical protein MI923_09830 [Phycisphaerales bacterium]|nr:hypothetical protein [Phycisphaerales bacterium]
MNTGEDDLYNASLVATNLWDKADWLGMGFVIQPNRAPFLGLLFQNSDVAQTIFSQWRKVFGEEDAYEILRISIIEGDIPGEDSGYSVLVGSNPMNLIQLEQNKGRVFDPRFFLTVSQIHRVNPDATSRNLELFKESYRNHGHYFLMPMLRQPRGLGFFENLQIKKHKINLMRVEELKENDVEHIVLRRTKDPATAQPITTEKSVDLTTLIAVLEEELVLGRIKRPINPFLLEQLASIRRDEDGVVIPESLDPTLLTLAETVMRDAFQREALAVPLRDIQAEYVDAMERFLGSLYKDMLETGATPHAVARTIANDRDHQKPFLRVAMEFSEAIQDFWSRTGPIVSIHLKKSSSLKAVYGGNVFPHPATELITSIGLYVDTLVLPDPIQSSMAVAEAFKPKVLVDRMLRDGLTAMRYLRLALAETKQPIVVFAPRAIFLEAFVRDIAVEAAYKEMLEHMSRIFDMAFDDVDQVKRFLTDLGKPDAVADRVRNQDRFVFDIDELPLPLDQLTLLSADHEMMNESKAPSALSDQILTQLWGRFVQVNEMLINSEFCGGTPICDAPTSWQYLLWKYEYNAQESCSSSSLSDLLIQHALHSESRVLWALREATPEAIIELRQSGVLHELRAAIRDGISKILSADEKSIRDVVLQVSRNIESARTSHEQEVASLKKNAGSLGIDATAFVGGAAFTIASMCSSTIPLQILGAIIGGAYSAPTGKDVYEKAAEWVAQRRNLLRTPAGILWGLKQRKKA